MPWMPPDPMNLPLPPPPSWTLAVGHLAARRAESVHDDLWHCARCCRRRLCNPYPLPPIGGIRWPRLCEECVVALVAWEARRCLHEAGVDSAQPCFVPGCLEPCHFSAVTHWACWGHLTYEQRRHAEGLARALAKKTARLTP